MNPPSPGPASLADALAQIPDPRRPHLRVHDLVPLLQLAVAAMLCGARSLYAIAQWGRERLADDPSLLAALGFPPGRSPSVATLHRVFKRIDAAAFETCVGAWLARTGLYPNEPFAVDGKTLRGIHGEQLPGVHLVAVYALQSRVVLAQMRVGGKGAEQQAVKAVLAQAPLAGHVVLGDALQTQRDICQQIEASGAEYFLPVKENQPQLREDLEAAFSPSVAGRDAAVGKTAGAGVAQEGVAATGGEADGGLPSNTKGSPRSA